MPTYATVYFPNSHPDGSEDKSIWFSTRAEAEHYEKVVEIQRHIFTDIRCRVSDALVESLLERYDVSQKYSWIPKNSEPAPSNNSSIEPLTPSLED